MRSFLMGTMVAVALTTLATTGSADEPAKLSTTRPKIELTPTIKVVGFRRAPGNTGPYVGGSLGIAVDVENTGNTHVDQVVVKLDIGGKILESATSLSPHTTRYVVFSDPDGLASSCKPKPYSIALSGQGTGEAVRQGQVTPTCTFTSKPEETWNLMSPDKVEAMKAGNAYLSSPAIVSSAQCNAGPTVKTRIVNKSGLSSPSIIVQAKEWNLDAKVRSQTAAAFPLAVNESKEVLLTSVGNSAIEPTTKMKLVVTDWTKSLGGHTSDGGIFINTTRSCALGFAME